MSIYEDKTTDKIFSDNIVFWVSRHWIFAINLIFGLIVLTPFMAPLFMAMGLDIPARVIYWFYSFLCHQLPERSYFLFGPKISYNLSEIQSVWHANNFSVLRQFVGNSQMGWKVAWSDRMVSMFSSIWLFGIIWGIFKKKITTIPWWGFLLLIFPMALDGLTHLISDFSGIGQGFRDSNTWLAILTNYQFVSTFYSGDAWGSFNAWMRLITGVLFGLGIVWFGFPFLDEAFANSIEVIQYKIQYRTLLINEKKHLAKMSVDSNLEN